MDAAFMAAGLTLEQPMYQLSTVRQTKLHCLSELSHALAVSHDGMSQAF